MMMFETSPRARILEAQAERLEEWYEREMDLLDERLMEGMSQAEYDRQAKALARAYDEDYADIYSG